MSDDKMTMPPRDSGSDRPDDPGHDPVSAAYRRAAGEQPPADLDAAVLDMAHREVNTIHVATPRPPWFVPVAVAATVVLAVSLGLQVFRAPPQTVATMAETSSTAAAPSLDDAAADAGMASEGEAAPLPPAQAPRAAARQAQQAPDAMAMRVPPSAYNERRDSDSKSMPGEAQRRLDSMAAALPPETADMDAARERALQSQLRAMLGESPNSRGDAEASSDMDYWRAIDDAVTRALGEAREPAEWLEIIKALDTAGERREARIEWLAFRAVYPDEPLPPDFPEIE